MPILLELVLQLFQRHLQILLGARRGWGGGGGVDIWLLVKQLVTKGERRKIRKIVPFLAGLRAFPSPTVRIYSERIKSVLQGLFAF